MFDLIVILILAVSGLVGFVRGAAREVVTVVAFVLSVIIAIFALRLTGPLARDAIHLAWLANAVAIIVVFIAAYIALRVLGAGLTRKIHDVQALGTLDRLVGFGFGLIRALVLLGVFNMVFNIATPPERTPKWVLDAKLYPLTEVSARALRTLAPKGSAIADRVAPVLEKAVQDGAKPGDKAGKQGYEARDPKTIDDLLEKSR